jgi:hypothetical protein
MTPRVCTPVQILTLVFDFETRLPANATVHMTGKLGGDGPDRNSTFKYSFRVTMEPGWGDPYDEEEEFGCVS